MILILLFVFTLPNSTGWSELHLLLSSNKHATRHRIVSDWTQILNVSGKKFWGITSAF